jgi:hypothetical protein
MEIKGGPNADQRYSGKAVPVLVHPPFLLWSADADKYNVSIRTLYPFHNLVIFGFCKRPERR